MGTNGDRHDPDPRTDAVLDALDRLRGTGPEYQEILANHGPMGSEALVRLGRAEAVPRWVERYKSGLREAPEPRGTLRAEHWSEHLGDVRLVGDWTALLQAEAAERTWTELLGRWWPRLLPGLAASATHGVIRTAHAVRSLASAGPDPHPLLVEELANGLAYWAARYQTLPGRPGLTGDRDAVHAVAALPRLDASAASPGPGIVGRLPLLGESDDFSDGLERWRAPQDPQDALTELVSASARVVAARHDAPIAFCHTVTCPAAVRLVLPHLPRSQAWPSVAAAWQASAGIVAAFASPRVDDESNPARWERGTDAGVLADLTDRAVAHGDEHVIKLTEAALRELAISGDRTLLAAADRIRENVPVPG